MAASEWVNHCHFGDVRAVLRRMIADGVQVNAIVTSPPYWGLRSYLPEDHPDKHLELGSEPTFAEFLVKMVEVFELCRQVLKKDGTMWVNMGDSYAQRPNGPTSANATKLHGDRAHKWKEQHAKRSKGTTDGFKHKDLIGQPWRLAMALQERKYQGQIASEVDRAWLAAIIDGEGCFFIHKRKAGTPAHSKYTRADGTEAKYTRTADTYGVGLEICNTSKAIIDRVQEIAGAGTITAQTPEQNARRKQTIYRWRVAPNEAKRLAQEVYPHLVGKQHQARLIFNCPSTGDAGAAAHQAMMDLHNGIPTEVDYAPPPDLFEPGWYLRQDVVWSKPNAMPESVTDRCTKAHEFIFLLSKSTSYYWDFAAMQEPVEASTIARLSQDIDGQKGSMRAHAGITGKPMKAVGGHNGTRNRRSVWTVATDRYSGAHFATFPRALVEPCVVASCPPGGVVLDPFFGSGTLGEVAQRLGRNYIGIDINSANQPLQVQRLQQPALTLEA